MRRQLISDLFDVHMQIIEESVLIPLSVMSGHGHRPCQYRFLCWDFKQLINRDELFWNKELEFFIIHYRGSTLTV